MSFELRIPAKHDQLPSSARWNELVRASGFDITLDTFEWDSHSGFLPATLLGCTTGFEMSFEKTPVGLLSRVLRSREQDDGAVVATLGSRWFEMVCASCSLAVLQMAIGSPDSYHDDQQVTASEAMAESRALYLQSNLLIARLRGGNLALPWDVPKRVDGESEVDRRAAIKQLVSARFLVPESGSDIECFRIHRNRRQELAAELGIDVSEANN